MTYIATVTSKSMITIPSEIRKKYKIKEGMKVKFVESETGVLMIPIPQLDELRGIDRQHATLIIQAIKELELEHREETKK
jgi:AbrB family looped-hinge helix DNA binding protein